MEGPENGDVFLGVPAGTTINFAGRFNSASAPIHVQVLADPDDESDLDYENWVTLETTTSASTPTDDGFGEYYAWSVNATPVPSSPTPAESARWPEGGLLRFRVTNDPETSPPFATFDQDRLECYQTVGMRQLLSEEEEDFQVIGMECKSNWTQAVLVSGSKTPTDLEDTPAYLSHREDNGVGSPTETLAYYNTIGAPSTLNAFKTRFGLGIGTPAVDEVSAVYFNAGDLGTGREMHCRFFTNDPVTPGSDSGVACYVSNYSDGSTNFGGDPAEHVGNAVAGFNSGAHNGAFATVAMWYTAYNTADNSVRFVVYDRNEPPLHTEGLLYEAQLDSKGYNKGIPQNCIVCHGGATYDATNHRVLGGNPSLGQNVARFLPFDISAFEFSTASGFTRAAQEEKFRVLNRLVLQTSPSAATQQLINGWYAAGSVNTAGTLQNTAYIPPGWTDGVKADEKIYSTVVAPYCRGCHVSRSDPFYTFADKDDFQTWGNVGYIQGDVCTVGLDPAKNHVMPNAEVTLDRFWKSPARAYLAGYFDMKTSCKP
ncbi:hypothetical protein [Sorangium sp. So ce1000]|uniref:hypothetical protein n=1 Tax=Sorangium sp. So ce1000 TaxID=3133325 RepID=UPI003F5F7CF0